MLDRLAHFVYTRRRLVLSAAGAFLAVAMVWGTGVFGSLVSGGFEDPTSESAKAATAAEQAFGRDASDVVVVYSSDTMLVRDPAFQAAVTGALAALPAVDLKSTTSYWSTGGAPALVSADGHATYVALQLTGATVEDRTNVYDALKDKLVAPGLTTVRGGMIPTNEAFNTTVTADIARAESISTPILVVLLILVFAGLAAASLPLAIGGLAILGAFTALRVISMFTDVSIFAVNIVTMLGLGLAIDYSLFIVTRFREELKARGGGQEAVEEALRATMRTAGRTVLFSGLTVALALSSLLLFDLTFLQSMGYGGVAAVLVAMVGALTVLPALLAVLGPKVNALKVPLPGFLRRSSAGDREHGPWYRIATSVMRRPLVYVVAIAAVLVAMGLPFRDVQWGSTDHRALPAGNEARQAGDALAELFPSSKQTPIDVVVTFDRPVEQAKADLGTYVQRLSAVPGVSGASLTGSSGDQARVSLKYTADSVSPAGRDLVQSVRDVPEPPGATALVGGFAASNADTLSAIGRTLPWAALWIVGGMLLLLFLAFGSLVLPVKAVLMNMLSLSASFGAVVWIFQEGHLSGLLSFTPVGTIESTQPVLMFAIAFGLAMDYEVFLLSRIREEWDRTGDNTRSVAMGLERTGKIITSAALLLIVVIGAFATSGVTFIKMIGVGVGLAVLIDATIVRALLVPATMRLLGRFNWWAPEPLVRFWNRYGFREESHDAAVEQAPREYATMET